MTEYPDAMANDDLQKSARTHTRSEGQAYQRILPPRPATGTPLMIRTAPKTPYAGSILMPNGIQSSPSFQGSVALARVPFSTVALLTVPLEKVVELTVSVSTRVVG